MTRYGFPGTCKEYDLLQVCSARNLLKALNSTATHYRIFCVFR